MEGAQQCSGATLALARDSDREARAQMRQEEEEAARQKALQSCGPSCLAGREHPEEKGNKTRLWNA